MSSVSQNTFDVGMCSSTKAALSCAAGNVLRIRNVAPGTVFHVVDAGQDRADGLVQLAEGGEQLGVKIPLLLSRLGALGCHNLREGPLQLFPGRHFEPVKHATTVARAP